MCRCLSLWNNKVRIIGIGSGVSFEIFLWCLEVLLARQVWSCELALIIPGILELSTPRHSLILFISALFSKDSRVVTHVIDLQSRNWILNLIAWLCGGVDISPRGLFDSSPWVGAGRWEAPFSDLVREVRVQALFPVGGGAGHPRILTPQSRNLAVSGGRWVVCLESLEKL